MKKQPLLLDVPQDSPTHKQRLEAFKKAKEIETYNSGPGRGIPPWIACHMPSAKEIREPYRTCEENDMGAIFADVCRLLDEAGVVAEGTTEREAVVKLCEKMKIPCDL